MVVDSDDFAVETLAGTLSMRRDDVLMESANGKLYALTAEDWRRCYTPAEER